jgi:hypothetical protein
MELMSFDKENYPAPADRHNLKNVPKCRTSSYNLGAVLRSAESSQREPHVWCDSGVCWRYLIQENKWLKSGKMKMSICAAFAVDEKNNRLFMTGGHYKDRSIAASAQFTEDGLTLYSLPDIPGEKKVMI